MGPPSGECTCTDDKLPHAYDALLFCQCLDLDLAACLPKQTVVASQETFGQVVLRVMFSVSKVRTHARLHADLRRVQANAGAAGRYLR